MTTPTGPAYRTAQVKGWATFHVPASGAAGAIVRGAASPVEAAPEPLALPPVLLPHRSLVEPLDPDAPGAPAAAAFTMPAELGRTVSADLPLRVDLDLPASITGNAFAIVPVASDGRFIYLAGRPVHLGAGVADRRAGEALRLEVSYLPDLGDEPPDAPEAATMRFGVGRAVKLAFLKIVGIPTAETGLRVPGLEGNRLSYRPAGAGELATGRTALLVHGFLSDTGWMVHALLEPLRRAGYDHVVTWDYETCKTRLQATAGDLAGALQTAGVQPERRAVDVIAHSQGTLVARAVVAQDRPAHLVRRALLMGAPNGGTPIAGLADRVVALASTFLNVSVGPVSAGAIVRFLWEGLDDGLDDLQPESAFLRGLNGRPARHDTPISLLVGDAAGDPRESLVQRLVHRTAAAFFGGASDLVVPVSSMNAVAAPPYPSVTAFPVDCNHFDYLVPGGVSRRTVDRWIALSGE